MRPVEQLSLRFRDPQQDLAGIFSRAHRDLRPRTPIPQIRVEFFPFAGINHTARLNHGQLTVRVSDLFDGAPDEVHHALAQILLAKLYRKKADASYHRTYRAFILRGEIQDRARAVRTDRGRGVRTTDAKGRHFDLESLFLKLNEQYFGSALDRPKISWSARRSRHILGRYDATHHAIFISRIFDSPRVPSFVVEYVMYHEMLHLQHQTRVKDCRVIVHTPEFRHAEQEFRHYNEAKAWLKSL